MVSLFVFVLIYDLFLCVLLFIVFRSFLDYYKFDISKKGKSRGKRGIVLVVGFVNWFSLFLGANIDYRKLKNTCSMVLVLIMMSYGYFWISYITTRKTAFRVGQKWTLKGQKRTLKPI
jgi:hypothetical protein